MSSFQQVRAHLLQRVVRLAPEADSSARGDASAPARKEGSGPIEELAFSRPPTPEMGDLALAVFPLARRLRLPPPEVARTWAEALRQELSRPGNSLSDVEVPVVRVETQGPYLNFHLDPAALARLVLADIAEAGSRYGAAAAPIGQTVVVEYSSPNTNKPLHLGHVRNGLIGMSLSNILEAQGDRVIRLSLINDRGIHICQSMLAYTLWAPQARAAEDATGVRGQEGGPAATGGRETPASTGEKGDHFVGRYYVLFGTRLREERREYARQRGVDLSLWSKEAIGALTDRDDQKQRTEEAERFEKEFRHDSKLLAGAADLLRRWEAGDAEVLALWRTMNEWVYEGLRQTYARLGCRFDRWDFESETWKVGKQEVEKGLTTGVFYRKEDGSVWAQLEPLGLQDKLVLRSDGTSVYITQDIGTAVRRAEDFHMQRCIYVVASEQVAHFHNLFGILKLLGYEWASRCHHASYGLVTLPKGMGKLKSREGISVDADDLLDELNRLAYEKIREGGYSETPEAAAIAAEQIGQGALKLYILQVSSEKNIQFNPAETIAFTGDTGPAVQYSHARIHGILRKGLAEGKLTTEDLTRTAASDSSGPFLASGAYQPGLLREPEEREVLRHLAEYPDMITLAARQLSAAPVANALLELTKAYARMYHQHEVLRAADPALLRARLQLGLCVAQVLRNGLGLLTIAAPERM